jgi:uncharacterized membrane protein YhfC
VSNSASWMAKSLLISAAIALAISVGLYMFLKIHQELDIAPAYAWALGAVAFLVSTIGTMIYYRMRTER